MIETIAVMIVWLPLLMFVEFCAQIFGLFGIEVNDMDRSLFMVLGGAIMLLPVAYLLDKIIFWIF